MHAVDVMYALKPYVQLAPLQVHPSDPENLNDLIYSTKKLTKWLSKICILQKVIKNYEKSLPYIFCLKIKTLHKID